MLGRFIRGCGIAALLLLLAAPSAFAQATGKIQGRVLDSQTGEAIAGATVRVLGTTRGGISGEDGFYFINEVPAGLQAILAEFIGRRSFRIENQRILAGQTTTLNFQLEVAAIELDPLIVEGERNPLVPRDQVSSKAIVTGELIDALPLDNAQGIVLLQPGVIDTNQGRTIRGSRPNEEAVYIDGVLTRRFATGEAEPIELPTNALAQVDVTTGGIGAQFSEAQSGVVNYVTRTGGTSFGGSVLVMTDQLGPKKARTGYNRVEASLGGPIWREQNLSFFLSGQLEGRKYAALNSGFDDIPILLQDGIATAQTDPRTGRCLECEAFGFEPGDPAVFFLDRESSASGGTDVLRVAFPNYTRWDNGTNRPFNPGDEYLFVGRLDWGLGGGSKVDLSYKREREQGVGLGLGEIYNPDGYDANLSYGNVLTLGGYFLLKQSASGALALDVKASYQTYKDLAGVPEASWLIDNRDPAFGFNFGGVKFMEDPENWPVSQALVEGARSNAIPNSALQIFPDRFDLSASQTFPGINENLRLNPYAMRTGWDIAGPANGGISNLNENSWVFQGTVDWQAGRYFRLQAGGDFAKVHVEQINVPLYTGRAAPALNEPTRGGLFATGRLDLGDVVIDAGLRYDYFDPDGQFSRVPGYVFNVPDSLRADFVVLTAGEYNTIDEYVAGLAPLEDCGGAATAAQRTNPETGQTVCKPNFIDASTKSALSPKLGVSFPVTVKSTFRLSYSHNVQTPAIGGTAFGTATATAGLFRNVYDDQKGGTANTNTTYGRDVDLPRTVLFEAGYRQLFGEDLVVDVAIYNKTARNKLTFRKILYEDPNFAGLDLYLNSLANKDFTQIIGVDLSVDKRFGQFADLSANYSYIDARGTGSDPFTYTGLLLRSNTNLSILTGAPNVPPDAILPLENSRTHNFAGTFSLLFPQDYMQGTTLGAIFNDFGTFLTFYVASGLNYTRLENSANGTRGPPTFAGLGGILDEELNASQMPWEKRLDVRFTKGFPLGGTRILAFVDWRNPLGLSNTNRVYLETGTANNEQFRTKQLNQQLADANLDGNTAINDFDIVAQAQGNDLNTFSLLQAEKRYGDGDGIFTVAEQTTAFGAWYDMFWGKQTLVESNQRLRLGLEIRF